MRKLALTTLLILVSTFPAFADELQDVVSNIRQRILAVRPELSIQGIEPSALPGFYDVQLSGGQTLYFTEDGQHFFTGDLYALTDKEMVNVSEQVKAGERKKLLDQLDESDMLVFAPAKDMIKATVTVFTDIDCTYCRKLHKEVPEMNRLGIAIRYLAYPRAGTGSASYDKIVSAWCADNPKIALTRAKAGKTIETRTCDNPVASQYELGGVMGVNSTPSLVFEDGTMTPGYLPAEALAKRLGIM